MYIRSDQTVHALGSYCPFNRIERVYYSVNNLMLNYNNEGKVINFPELFLIQSNK